MGQIYSYFFSENRTESQSESPMQENTVSPGESLTSLFSNLPPLQPREIRPRIQVERPQLFVNQDGLIVQNPQNNPSQNGPSQEEIARRYAKLRVRELSEKEAKESCAICLTEFEEGKGVELPDCGHIFHEKCIKKWLEQKNTCPLCTQPVA